MPDDSQLIAKKLDVALDLLKFTIASGAGLGGSVEIRLKALSDVFPKLYATVNKAVTSSAEETPSA